MLLLYSFWAEMEFETAEWSPTGQFNNMRETEGILMSDLFNIFIEMQARSLP